MQPPEFTLRRFFCAHFRLNPKRRINQPKKITKRAKQTGFMGIDDLDTLPSM
jgi:hypothetical protein